MLEGVYRLSVSVLLQVATLQAVKYNNARERGLL
jgi:hypothetical protein